MKPSPRSFLSVLWGTGLTFQRSVNGASLLRSGAPGVVPDTPPPIHGNTDFNSIFSDIRNHKVTPLQSGPTIVTRDIPPTPQFFTLAFPAPLDEANNAIGYMGFESLATYDVNACAEHCNIRAFTVSSDGLSSGACAYFNIWTAVVNGTPTANICSMYDTATDSSTATNNGQAGDIQIINSLGYNRTSLVQDGSFQDFTCVDTQTVSCPFEPSNFWERFFEFNYDFVLIGSEPGSAHSGTSSANFFFVPPSPNSPAFGSTLTYVPILTETVPGQSYIISLFVSNSDLFPVPQPPTGTLVSVFWNNVNVLDVAQATFMPTEGVTYFNFQVTVVAQGDDTLFLKNGFEFPHAANVDDVSVFPKWF